MSVPRALVNQVRRCSGDPEKGLNSTTSVSPVSRVAAAASALIVLEGGLLAESRVSCPRHLDEVDGRRLRDEVHCVRRRRTNP